MVTPKIRDKIHLYELESALLGVFLRYTHSNVRVFRKRLINREYKILTRKIEQEKIQIKLEEGQRKTRELK